MSEPSTHAADLPLEAMLQAFRDRLERGSPFADERELAVDLTVEAGPVLEALHYAWCVVDAQGEDPLGHSHEALAMLTLLGRRAATGGVSPTAALAVAPSLRDALYVAGLSLPDHVERALSIVCMEGYCAGRDDRARRSLREGLIDAQRILVLAPQLVWWSVVGALDAEGIAEAGDRAGRKALEVDAKACVLDLGQLSDPGEEKARAIAGAAGQLRSIGAEPLLVAGDGWRAVLAALDAELAECIVADAPEPALRAALALTGASLTKANMLTRWFSL